VDRAVASSTRDPQFKTPT